MTARGGVPPLIDCKPVAPFNRGDLASVRAAFDEATPIPLGQCWLDEDEPGFSPAIVRAGWQDGSLVVLAELTDADIFTAATDHHQRFWELGDTFEIFLRPVQQDAYVELHVTPDNLRLQLRFSDAEMIARLPPAAVFTEALQTGALFQSHTWAPAGRGQWIVLAEIPAASVCEPPGPLPGATWRFSFSRYDYTRRRRAPVISSSSPHAQPSFHRQQEWGVLRFVR